MLPLTTRKFKIIGALLLGLIVSLNTNLALAQTNRMPAVGVPSGIAAFGDKTSGTVHSSVRPAEPANLIMLVGRGTTRKGRVLTAGIKTYINNVQTSVPLNTTATSQETTAVYPILSALGYPSGARLAIQVIGITTSGNGIYSKALLVKLP
jgi:hypothetical protein